MIGTTPGRLARVRPPGPLRSLGENNKEWADRIIRRVDPTFRHRWEAYENAVADALTPTTVWIDCGCGNNSVVRDLSHLARFAVGVDVAHPAEAVGAFVLADIRRLPFPSEFADLITLRFVVEHFSEINSYFDEVSRVLKKDGKVLILTTNALSPMIAIPRLLLPFRLKNRILTSLFRVEAEDVFRTYHKLNTPRRFKRGVGALGIQRLEFISDLNYVRKWVFMILLACHILTMPRFLQKFRMNLLAVYEKQGSSR